MSIKIKNWKLTLLALLLCSLLTSLGVWQLSRATQKKLLLASYANRGHLPPLNAQNLAQISDKRFYRVTLRGVFDNQHTFLLDNKTFYGQIGYEVYTLFKAQGLSQAILVDRGFIRMESDRSTLPTVREISGTITLTGLLNLPPTYVAFGKIHDSPIENWPLRIEFIDLKEIAKLSKIKTDTSMEEIYPYILMMTPNHTAAYPIEWKIVSVGPERHGAYALQWFALALTLLILWAVLNWRS